MTHSIITSKGQITIPKSVRSRLNLKTGDKIDFEIQNGTIRLIPVSKSVSDVFGMLSGKSGKTHSIDEINERLKKRMGDKNK